MKSSNTKLTRLLALTSTAASALIKRDAVSGFDISHYQSSVDFAQAYADGARFVIIKATEGTTYTDPSFSDFYDGATAANFIRGAYHFAHPDESASAQAQFFVANGGSWSGDGITLPGMVDLESEGGSECYGLSPDQVVAWISEFSDAYQAATTRYPMIYTNPSWWDTCTGNSNAFVDTSPLVLARYASAPGAVPGGWPYYTIWQNSDAAPWGGDSDQFNGDETQLTELATG